MRLLTHNPDAYGPLPRAWPPWLLHSADYMEHLGLSALTDDAARRLHYGEDWWTRERHYAVLQRHPAAAPGLDYRYRPRTVSD